MRRIGLCLISILMAVSITPELQSAGDALLFPASAKSYAMAGTMTSVFGNAESASYNIAGMGYADGPQVSFMNAWWFTDYSLQCVNGSYPLSSRFSIAAGIKHLSSGLFRILDSRGIHTGSVGTEHCAAILGAALDLGFVMAGIGLKYAYDRYAAYDFHSAVLDAGAAREMDLGDAFRLSLGFSARNIGLNLARNTDCAAIPMPLTLSLGTGCRTRGSTIHGFRTDIEIEYVLDSVPKLAIGAEYIFRGILAARAGYSYWTGRNGVASFGAGFRVPMDKFIRYRNSDLKDMDMEVNWSMAPFADTLGGNVHCLTIGLSKNLGRN